MSTLPLHSPTGRIYRNIAKACESVISIQIIYILIDAPSFSIMGSHISYELRRIFPPLQAATHLLLAALPILSMFFLFDIYARARGGHLKGRDLLPISAVLLIITALLAVEEMKGGYLPYDEDFLSFLLLRVGFVLLPALFCAYTWVQLWRLKRYPASPLDSPPPAYDFSGAERGRRTITLAAAAVRILLAVFLLYIGFTEFWVSEIPLPQLLSLFYLLLSIAAAMFLIALSTSPGARWWMREERVALWVLGMDLFFMVLPLLFFTVDRLYRPLAASFEDQFVLMLISSLHLIPTSLFPFLTHAFLRHGYRRWYGHIIRGGWAPGADYLTKGTSSASSLLGGIYLTAVFWIVYLDGEPVSVLIPLLGWLAAALSIILLLCTSSPLSHVASFLSVLFSFSVAIILLEGALLVLYVLPAALLSTTIMGPLIAFHGREERRWVGEMYRRWAREALLRPLKVPGERGEGEVPESESGAGAAGGGGREAEDYLLIIHFPGGGLPAEDGTPPASE